MKEVNLREIERNQSQILNQKGEAVGEIAVSQKGERSCLTFSIKEAMRGLGYASDAYYQPQEGQRVLYLAGGCFWGMEKAFRELRGVTETAVGYANGSLEHPTYAEVCRDNTGHRETIRVSYDPKILSLEKLLRAYFICIDPTQADGQGNDIGSQYLTGIYYQDAEMLPEIEAFLAKERVKYPEFHVELKPLSIFWLAEDYHQDYLTKNPGGYCHIASREFAEIRKLNEE